MWCADKHTFIPGMALIGRRCESWSACALRWWLKPEFSQLGQTAGGYPQSDSGKRRWRQCWAGEDSPNLPSKLAFQQLSLKGHIIVYQTVSLWTSPKPIVNVKFYLNLSYCKLFASELQWSRSIKKAKMGIQVQVPQNCTVGLLDFSPSVLGYTRQPNDRVCVCSMPEKHTHTQKYFNFKSSFFHVEHFSCLLELLQNHYSPQVFHFDYKRRRNNVQATFNAKHVKSSNSEKNQGNSNMTGFLRY